MQSTFSSLQKNGFESFKIRTRIHNMCVSVCAYTLLHMNLQRTRFATIDHRFVYKNEANENKKGEGENQTI